MSGAGRSETAAAAARRLRQEFYARIARGEMTVHDGIRQMRAMLGMTQAQFGARFRLTTRQVSELENGRANPTAETLDRLGRPFGLRAGFVRAETGQEQARDGRPPVEGSGALV